MAQFDTIIKGGTIVDGTRVPRYGADVGMKNGKIAQIGRLHSSDAKQVIDASGLLVVPGFTVRMPARMTLEDWNLFDSVPAWREATVGTREEKKVKLANPALRQSMREEYDKGGMEALEVIFGELPTFIQLVLDSLGCPRRVSQYEERKAAQRHE